MLTLVTSNSGIFVKTYQQHDSLRISCMILSILHGIRARFKKIFFKHVFLYSFSNYSCGWASPVWSFLFQNYLLDISIKLASIRYLLCKEQVVPILHGYGLLSYITNDSPCLATTVTTTDGTVIQNPATTKWLRIDQLILG
jgi:small basic protein